MALPVAAWAEIGQIKLLAGQASVERNAKIIPAKKGMLVEIADVIITGKDGRVGITFKDNTRFAAGPNSHIELTEFLFNPTTRKGSFITKVERGTLAIVSGDISKFQPDAMKVRTPSSILGVRGTKFLVKVGP
jgi:hypothetical protein